MSRRFLNGPILNPRLVPTVPVELDTTHPLAGGLIGCYVAPYFRDLTGTGPTLAPLTATPIGKNSLGPAWIQQTGAAALYAPVTTPYTMGSNFSVAWLGCVLGGYVGPYDAIIAGIDDSSNGRPAWGMERTNTNDLWARSYDNGTTQYIIGPTYSYTNNLILPIAATFSSSSMYLYANGSLLASGGEAAPNISSSNRIAIGGLYEDSSRCPNIATNSSLFWNRILAANEIAWLAAEPFTMLRPIVRRAYYNTQAISAQSYNQAFLSSISSTGITKLSSNPLILKAENISSIITRGVSSSQKAATSVIDLFNRKASSNQKNNISITGTKANRISTVRSSNISSTKRLSLVTGAHDGVVINHVSKLSPSTITHDRANVAQISNLNTGKNGAQIGTINQSSHASLATSTHDVGSVNQTTKESVSIGSRRTSSLSQTTKQNTVISETKPSNVNQISISHELTNTHENTNIVHNTLFKRSIGKIGLFTANNITKSIRRVMNSAYRLVVNSQIVHKQIISSQRIKPISIVGKLRNIVSTSRSVASNIISAVFTALNQLGSIVLSPTLDEGLYGILRLPKKGRLLYIAREIRQMLLPAEKRIIVISDYKYSLGDMTNSFSNKAASDNDARYGIDLGDVLATGEIITSVTSVTSKPAGLNISNPTIHGSQITWQVSGGFAGIDYTVTITFSTNMAPSLARSVILPVRDIV